MARLTHCPAAVLLLVALVVPSAWSSRPLHDAPKLPSNTSKGDTHAVVWDQELASLVTSLLPQRAPNTTRLRGPSHIAGTYKGTWTRAVYGSALNSTNFLQSERGIFILQVPASKSGSSTIRPASRTSAGASAAARSPGGTQTGDPLEVELPGGVQDIQADLIIRDGTRLSDFDVRFRLRGVYVPAAGLVRGVLEPLTPVELPLDPGERAAATAAAAGRGVSRNSTDGNPQQLRSGRAGEVAAGAGARAAAEGGRGRDGAEEEGAGVGDERRDAAIYRQSLRTAARNVAMGRWYGGYALSLLHSPPPAPPAPPRSRRTLAAPSPPPPPPLPLHAATGPAVWQGTPLELNLHKACEFRVQFNVYYKGDPAARSHAGFLQLDAPAPPPEQPSALKTPSAHPARSRRHHHHQPGHPTLSVQPLPGSGHTPLSGAPQGTTGVPGDHHHHHHSRHLFLDTEMYHTSQVELHGPTRSTTSTSSDSAPFDTDPAASPSGQSTGSPTHKADPENGRASSTAEIEPYSYGTVYDIPDDMDPDDPDLELVGLVLSPECGLALAFNASSVHLERYFRQVVRYSIAITAITIAEIVLCVQQMEASSTPSASARMSLYSVTLQTMMDTYQCLVHLGGALVVDALFGAFASIAFLQFLLFALVEIRQTLLVWRAQRNNGRGDDSMWNIQRDMSAVYTRFYSFLLLGIVAMLVFRSQLPLLVLLLHSWWVPQVVHSATTDTRPPLKMGYLWGMSALRLITPLYFFGCPSNLLRVEQRLWLCAALVTWVALQATVVTLQMKWGPRACIPRALLPHKYDYHRPATAREIGLDDGAGAAGHAGSGHATHGSLTRGTAGLRRLVSWLLALLPRLRSGSVAGTAAGGGGSAAGSRFARARGGSGGGGGGGVGRGGRASDDGDVETGHGSKECVICMSPVPLFPLNARMLTPCGHFFHQHCLTRWMEVKLDCPTCRRPLPPP